MWQQIKELCERTLLAIKPSLIEHYGYNLAGKVGHHPHGTKGFQIIGLDIIFEDNCRPKLLELNANCSLSCLSPMQDPDDGGVFLFELRDSDSCEYSCLAKCREHIEAEIISTEIPCRSYGNLI